MKPLNKEAILKAVFTPLHDDRKPPTTGTQLAEEIHEFINGIVNISQSPHEWPLTQEEQCLFIRKVVYQAQQIQKSSDYMHEEMTIASRKLALQALEL